MVINPENTEIIITGANGFVGSNVLQAVVRRYPNVTIKAFVRKRPRQELANVIYLFGDLPEQIPAGLFNKEHAILLHFASLLKADKYRDYHQINVDGTKKLLEASKDKIKCIIYGSSMSVYGQGPFNHIGEQDILRPETDLALSRHLAEKMIMDYSLKNNNACFLLRPRFIFGKHDKHTMPALIKLHQQGRLIGSGKQKFSYIDVQDYANIVVSLIEKADAEKIPLNIAYPSPISLYQLFDLIGTFNKKIKIPVKPIIFLSHFIHPLKKIGIQLQLIGQDQVLNTQELTKYFPEIKEINGKEKIKNILITLGALNEVIR